jgi:hypothetical protein
VKFVKRSAAQEGLFDEIHDAVQAVEERPLKSFVTIALWDDEDGDPVSLISDAPPLEVHGYLLDAVYASAHRTGDDGDAETKAFDDAGDVRRFDKGRMDVVSVGGSTIGRGVFAPGWKWSESVQPVIGTDSCPLSHVGYVVAGRMAFRMDDGTTFEASEGEAIHVAPGHDAWTVGDEPCVILEIRSAADYGQRV